MEMTLDELRRDIETWADGLDGEPPQDEDIEALVDLLMRKYGEADSNP